MIRTGTSPATASHRQGRTNPVEEEGKSRRISKACNMNLTMCMYVFLTTKITLRNIREMREDKMCVTYPKDRVPDFQRQPLSVDQIPGLL